MKAKALFCFLLIGVFLTSGCLQPANEGEKILIDVIYKYNSLATFKATESTSMSSFYDKRIPVYEEGIKSEVKTEKITESSAWKRQLLYKRPLKMKVVEEDGRFTIINGSKKWARSSQNLSACESDSKFYTGMFNAPSNIILGYFGIFRDLYQVDYLGTETMGEEKLSVIQLLPKQERNPLSGSELEKKKIWVNKDSLIKRIEVFNKSDEVYITTTFDNIEINGNISDQEFEISDEFEILPKVNIFYSLQTAEEDFGSEIKVPQYIPEGVNLDSIEIKKMCNNQKIAELNYKSQGRMFFKLTELIDLDGVMGRDGKVCYGEIYLIDNIVSEGRFSLSEEEKEKIMQDFNCWREGGVVLPN